MTKSTVTGDAGYTLVELLVVLTIFAIVMGLTTASFNRIVATSGQRISGAESEIEGLIGLEVMRADLELAGFGLPYGFQNPPNYLELDSDTLSASMKAFVNKFPNADPALYNDVPPSAPRAVFSGNNCGLNGSDYLVVKGSSLGTNGASKKTSYMTYSSPQPVVRRFKNPDTDLQQVPLSQNPNIVIVLNSVMRGGVATKELVMSGNHYSFPFVSDLSGIAYKPFIPKLVTDNYLVYGIAGAGTTLAAPFNRADYFVFQETEPTKERVGSSRCAPNTGTLYKNVLNHGGGFTLYPLLDCVADMQVVYGIHQDPSRPPDQADLYEDEIPDSSGKKPSDGGNPTAADVRAHVCEVRVYILAHEGKKTDSIDRFTYPSNTVPVGIVDGNGNMSAGKNFDLTQIPDWQRYRWKVYTIVVHPKNF